MVKFSISRHYRLRLVRSLRTSMYATLRAAVAVQIGYLADLSRLSFRCAPSVERPLRALFECPNPFQMDLCRQRARVHCAHPPAQLHTGAGSGAQPCGRLSPCKSSVLTICPSTRQICLEQIWTSAGRPQGVRHGRRTSKIRRDHRIT